MTDTKTADLLALADECIVAHSMIDVVANGNGTLKAILQRSATALRNAAASTAEPVAYDAGLLSDFGGGNVEWWWDYIRSELGHAHQHYAAQFTHAPDRAAVWRDAVEACAKILDREANWYAEQIDRNEEYLKRTGGTDEMPNALCRAKLRLAQSAAAKMRALSQAPHAEGEAGPICRLCNRTLGQHSHDTADTCNMFIPRSVSGDEGNTAGNRDAGVASRDVSSEENIRSSSLATPSATAQVVTEVAKLRQALKVWDGYGGFKSHEQVVDDAHAVANAARALLPSLEEVGRLREALDRAIRMLKKIERKAGWEYDGDFLPGLESALSRKEG